MARKKIIWLIRFTFLLCAATILLSFGKAKESAVAHHYLDGLRGLEVGASAHNPFGLKTLNVDYTNAITPLKRLEIDFCGEYRKVDLVAPGDRLPFKDNTWDFVINSHVLQFFYDPVTAVEEWLRVIKPGGYIFLIIPHKERTDEWNKPRTRLVEIVERHLHPNPIPRDHCTRHCIWKTEDFIELCDYYKWNIVECHDCDDKVGNGFMVILKK